MRARNDVRRLEVWHSVRAGCSRSAGAAVWKVLCAGCSRREGAGCGCTAQPVRPAGVMMHGDDVFGTANIVHAW